MINNNNKGMIPRSLNFSRCVNISKFFAVMTMHLDDVCIMCALLSAAHKAAC